MCQINDPKVYVAKEDFRIYKSVFRFGGQRFSSITPYARTVIWRFNSSQGVSLRYTKGATVRSPSGPGIMGFTWRCYKGMIILNVPKGTRYRIGEHYGHKIICADKVEVIS